LDVIGELSLSLCQLLTSVIFICVACGWTLTCGQIEPAGRNSNAFERTVVEIMLRLRRLVVLV